MTSSPPLPNDESIDPTESLLTGLNAPQREAVTATPGNQLIVAGAGSGKTRVLVHRMAYLIKHYGFGPYELMAVTFTNKAARVMAGRVSELLDIETRYLWIGTFHGLANRMLRSNFELADLPRDYQILDASDQRRLIKQMMEDRHMDTKAWTPQQACNWISRHKDDGTRPFHIETNGRPSLRQRAEFYAEYDAYCQSQGYVDFGEILLRCHEMLLDNDALLKEYQQRFSEILVDEFQDTNTIQYHWIRLLAGRQSHVMAVGDDDQSIYGWRGAVVENIRSFERDFENTKVIRLEQNYRSTGNILGAANHVIKNNADRLGKELWTDADAGSKITVVPCNMDIEQADYVTDELSKWESAHLEHTYDHVAVLYRSHFQSRMIESALQTRGISYTIRGGMRFYERAEIRDVLSYMQLISLPESNVAFDRALNSKPRGLGPKAQELMREFAAATGLNAMAAAAEGVKRNAFPGRVMKPLREFLNEISELADKSVGRPLAEIAEICVNDSGLRQYYLDKERDRQAQESRRENLQEFIRACGSFEESFLLGDAQDPDKSTLQAFLDSVSLDAGDVDEDLGPSVSLMTLHAAKGLEFPLVFIIGMNEGRFPHHLSLAEEDGRGIYEERRLAYVGLTRAMEQLQITYTKYEADWQNNYNRSSPSRFIKEIPAEFLEYPTLREASSDDAYPTVYQKRRRW